MRILPNVSILILVSAALGALSAGAAADGDAATQPAPPAPSVHLTAAQSRALGLQIAAVQTVTYQPILKLPGVFQADPHHQFIVAAPLAGTVEAMTDRPWPHLGDKIAHGQAIAAIGPTASSTLRVQLALQAQQVKADLASAQVAKQVADAALKRLEGLYRHEQSVSLQRVQAAQAAQAQAAARVEADTQNLAAISRDLRSGGAPGGRLPLPVFLDGTITQVLAQPGQAVAAHQPLFGVENFQSLLAAVALPAGQSAQALTHGTIQVQALGHRRWLEAKFLLIGRQADRQTGGLTVLYRVENPGSLRPEMALTAQVPRMATAQPRSFIPRSAVIWWQGQRWVYCEAGAGRFGLTALPRIEATARGYVVAPQAIPAGQRIVTRGAELLLNMQLASTIRKAG